MPQFAKLVGVPLPVIIALAWLGLALSAGSLVRFVALAQALRAERRKRFASLRTWWELFAVTTVAVLAGRVGVFLLLAIFSTLSLREFLALGWKQPHEARRLRWIYFVVPVHYGVLFFSPQPAAATGISLGIVLAISGGMAVCGWTHGFLRTAASLSWASLLLVCGLSHAAGLYNLADDCNPVAGSAGWFLYLVALTEINDIAQALWGRAWGRHRITPRVSPHKTWEGLLLGVATTSLAALLLGPLLTPWSSRVGGIAGEGGALPPEWLAGLAGLLIGCSGFFGDITMSALKRDAGVKDSSQLLPGQGGLLDRVDSLIFTAPLFFYFVLSTTS